MLELHLLSLHLLENSIYLKDVLSIPITNIQMNSNILRLFQNTISSLLF